MIRNKSVSLVWHALLLLSALGAPAWAQSSQPSDSLEQNFAHPPGSARPWVYWFWSNGNVNKEGITADLEAMKRVGIGGVLIMDVVERFAPPEGMATFMGPKWQELFQFALQEAHRLGLEVNMTNGPGWCGSSGPWITPRLSMQTLVSSDTSVAGPTQFNEVLPKPQRVAGKKDRYDSKVMAEDFYREVAVLAFPEPVNGMVSRDQVFDLTMKMSKDGHLTWDVPAGNWIIQRIGHTSTGSSTRPPVLGGNGLECDKLSKEAMDVHFTSMMKKLIDAAGPLAGPTLVATHIDSWEVGKQNWTQSFRDDFQERRGYDPTPLLPDITSKLNIGGRAMADRFRWDFYQTIAELMAENYTGHIAELAHEHGMRFTLEGYNLPFGDEQTYTAAADEPMTEFWTLGKSGMKETQFKAHQMASVAHLYGRPIVGAESFTSTDNEKWRQTPATIKAEGDFEMCQGVNRFVFHRYAFQPWPDRLPGATMGPWGLHYERTNTWWDWSLPWHQYVARCSYMLRQGLFAADILYVRPEVPNQTYFTPTPAPPDGFQYDQASAQSIIERASVLHNRIVLPDGMSYRILVLPTKQTTMTPAFLRKLKELVTEGAIISGPPPRTSPSLADYPQCDQTVAEMAREMWGDCDGKNVTEHDYGKGRVLWGQSLLDALASLQVTPDFVNNQNLNWIHRHLPDAEIYFISNEALSQVTAKCTFRVAGLRPELWNPQTGAFSAVSATDSTATAQTLDITLDPSGSMFVVFRAPDVVSPNLTQPIGQTQLLTEITGPWDIHFPPNRGAPDKSSFPSLISWSDSGDEGIKYFSGTATYTKTFAADPLWVKPDQRVVLDLGDVQVMADVTLNGKDLGILWKPPYRVDVSNAVQAGDNSMQISVVNLWPNRMIGDAALPTEKRITWSTWEPFKNDDPLLKSGLLGPVTLQAELNPPKN
jgi:hypothetical protein